MSQYIHLCWEVSLMLTRFSWQAVVKPLHHGVYLKLVLDFYTFLVGVSSLVAWIR